MTNGADRFFAWFDKKHDEAKDVIEWLNENSGMSDDWSIYHSGGGCTHYCCDIKHKGMDCYVLLCDHSNAKPDFIADVGWCMAIYPDDPNWDHGRFPVGENDVKDLRDRFKPENLDMDCEFLDW